MRPGKYGLAVLATPLVVALLFGCASAREARESVVDWVEGSAQPARSAYARVSYAKLHAEPDASSPVVAELALHQPVFAYQVENGFVFVRPEDGGRTGWVRTGDLVDRLPPPAPRTRAKPAPEPRPQVEPADVEPGPEPTPESEPAASEPEPEPPVEEPERSVFDPY